MNETLKRTRCPISSAVQIALLAGMPGGVALAQDTNYDDLAIDEVVVVARKREETLVEIPMNIATVNSEEILARNLLQREDVYRTIAGASAPRGQLILRGLSGGNDSTPDTTSVFTDDIPYDTSDLFDVQRIEVLRGPQGTLFGSNAIGGTVRVITNKPVMNEIEVMGAGVMTTERNRSGVGTRVYAGINFPIVEDKVAARIIGSYGQRDGKIMNTFSGTAGRESDQFLRAQVAWLPAEEWNINFSYIHERGKESGHEWADRSQPGYYYEASLTENPAATYGYDVTLNFPACDNPEAERPECRSGAPISGSHDPKFSVWETMDPWLDDEYNVFALRISKTTCSKASTLCTPALYRTTSTRLSTTGLVTTPMTCFGPGSSTMTATTGTPTNCVSSRTPTVRSSGSQALSMTKQTGRARPMASGNTMPAITRVVR